MGGSGYRLADMDDMSPIREIADVRRMVDEIAERSDKGLINGLVVIAHNTDDTFDCGWTGGAELEIVRILGMLEFLRADLIRKAEARSSA